MAALTAPARTGLWRPREWWPAGLSDLVNWAVQFLRLVLNHKPLALILPCRCAGQELRVVSKAN